MGLKGNDETVFKVKGAIKIAGVFDQSDQATPVVTDLSNQEIQMQLIEEGKPMKLTSLYVDRPFCFLVSGFIMLLMVSMFSSSQGYFELSSINNRDYLVWNSQEVNDWDKEMAGREAILEAQSQDQKAIRIQNTLAWNPIILIKAPNKTESLLTKDYLL